MTPAVPRFLSAALSDQGRVRGNNEDRVYTDDVRGIFAVIDGMGGHAAGEQAAAIAAERLKARLERQTGTVEQRIREAITLANNGILEAAHSRPEWNGMACVLTVAVIEDGHATIGHVGDSRLYKLARGKIEKVTHDHSPVGEREDGGELTEDEAMQHPRRNEVYRDVGSVEHTPDDEEFIDISRVPFEPDGALLLCSDGLSDVVPSSKILETVAKNAGDRQKAVQALIDQANADSKDNVSVILIEGASFAASLGKRPRKKSRQPIQTDPPVEEDTGRLTAVRVPQIPLDPPRGRPWVWFVCGLVIGAVLFAGLGYFLRSQQPPLPRTLHVGTGDGTFASISAALEAATPGDTVEVPPGHYNEAVHLKDRVDLLARPPGGATIEGGVHIDGIRRARFQGFRVQGGENGIAIKDSHADVELCDVSGAHLAGVSFTGAARGSLAGSVIHDNSGPGVFIASTAAPTLANNLILNNGKRPGDLKPGLDLRAPGLTHIENNTFASNGAEAIWAVTPTDESLLTHNLFVFEGKPDNRRKLHVITSGANTH